MLKKQVQLVPRMENNPKYIGVSLKIILTVHRFMFAHKQLHIGLDRLNSNILCFGLQKGSPLMRPFNRMYYILNIYLLDLNLSLNYL